MQSAILVVNAGSSSIKFSAYAAGSRDDLTPLFDGQVAALGSAPKLAVSDAGGKIIAENALPLESSHEAVFESLIRWMEDHLEGTMPAAVGHRVVHGGTRFAAPVRIDQGVLTALDSLSPLAPLHQPHNLAAIRAVAAVAPSLPQVACFDTAFHHGQPSVAQRFALPREMHAAGVRRYGFHGLSYEYIASALRERAPDLARGRVVVAHLGAGASMCAMRDGKSIDSTMGFTALDGLPMATRCGALDPGVILYLLRERQMGPDQIEDLLYHRSGLFGVSGLSGDMRQLLSCADPRAAEAIDLFVYRIARELGALAATLGGLDGLVFTGGIGEHAPEIRRRVCENSRWLGIALDQESNQRGVECISSTASAVAVWAIPTDEELVIARSTIRVLETERAQV